MYHAKELGQSQYAFYREEMRVAALDRLMLESELRRAIDAEEFLLYYQPQVDIRTSEIVGVEALLRWQHPVRGLIGPSEFLAVAEQAGLMGNMGRWVLDAACSQARLWLDDGLTFGRLSVNLGAQEFLRQDVVKLVATTLEQSRIPAR
jgi:EAL domain-containing protein (putative c-di-GMP-specific phosphodiesterase class I)